jgi:predicted nicotinamide N-methyase
MSGGRAADVEAFIRANTRILAPPLVPEIRLHLAEESLPIWQKTEEELGEINVPPPYWAFAWAGGQALARYVLDNPAVVAGRTVLDLAAGSGLTGIAAALAGAAEVTGNDIDAFAGAAMRINAALNGVSLMVSFADLLVSAPVRADVILVGDLFYEKPLAQRTLAWISACQQVGSLVIAGDPRRTYFPRHRFEPIQDYCVPVSRELEDTEIKHTAVWRLLPG